jgi:MFS family permease
MAVARVLEGLGSTLWVAYLPKVLVALGAGGVMVGAFGTTGAVLGIAFPYIGGVLSDRLGRGNAMILAALLAAAGYAVYAVAPVWWLFLPGLVLLSAAASFSFMGSMAMTGQTVPRTRRATSMASRGVFGTVAGLIGPPVGGVLILRMGLLSGVRIGLLVTIALTLLGVLLQRRLYRIPNERSAQPSSSLRHAWHAMRPEIKRMLAADCLVRFGHGMYAMFVVLYAMDVLSSSALQFGLLTSSRMATWALLSIPAARLADRAGTTSRRPFVVMGFFLLAAAPLVLVASPSADWLFATFVVFGLFDVCEAPRKSLVVDLCDTEMRGSLLGAYHLVRGAAVFPASLLGGVLWEWKPVAPFVAGAVVVAVGLLWFVVAGGPRGEQSGGRRER